MNKRKRKIVLALAGIVIISAAISCFLLLRFVRVPTGSMANTILPGDRLAVSLLSRDTGRGDIVIFRYPQDPSIRYVSRVIGLPGETIEIRENKVYINSRELPERRITVQPQIAADPAPLKIVREEEHQQGAEWTVYYYQRDEENGWPGFIGEGGLEGGASSFKVPVKGDALPDEISSNPVLKQVYDGDNDGRYDSDQYFCMGDNRDNSEDSRYWGTVPQHFIVGKPVLIYWSAEPDQSNGEKTRWDRVFSRLK